jgi:sortase A
MALSVPVDGQEQHDRDRTEAGAHSKDGAPLSEMGRIPPPELGIIFAQELLRRARGVRALDPAEARAVHRYFNFVQSTARGNASQLAGHFVLDAFTQVRQAGASPAARTPWGVTRAAPRRAAAWATVFTWIRNVGAIILLFVAWQLWGTSIAQHQAQNSLRSQFDATIHRQHAAPTTSPFTAVPLVPATVPVSQPAEGSGLARLQIPALGVDQIVVAGTSTGDLAKGPGHYTGTALPGQSGNIAIAGHRTTDGAPFNRLGTLSVGDRIVLTASNGQPYTYRVSSPPVAVSPSDVAVLDNFGDNRITLTTCTPEFSAAQRLVVVGEYTGGGAAIPSTARAKPVPYGITDSNTASWNWGALPVVLPEVGLLVGLGLLAKRFRLWLGRHAQWLLLVPLWLVGLYFLFQSLTSLLPPSV